MEKEMAERAVENEVERVERQFPFVPLANLEARLPNNSTRKGGGVSQGERGWRRWTGSGGDGRGRARRA